MSADFEVIHVDSRELMDAAQSVRLKVFVEEQGIDRRDEIDKYEDESSHFLIQEKLTGMPVGTARWRRTSQGCKLERFCVLPQFRRQGAGSLLLRKVMADIENHCHHPFMYLNAQADAVSLYEKEGFRVSGERFLECNIPHYLMVLPHKSQPEE